MNSKTYYENLILDIVDDIVGLARRKIEHNEELKQYSILLEHKNLLIPAVVHIVENRLRGSRSVYPQILEAYYNGYSYRYIVNFLKALGLIAPKGRNPQSGPRRSKYKMSDLLCIMLERRGVSPIWRH